MQRILERSSALLLTALGALALTACSDDDSSSAGPGTPGPPSGSFAIVTANVVDGSVWQLNRPIDLTFNQDVDFSTVSPSTIQIVDTQGRPAVGTFTQRTSTIVRFQPRCPTNDDNSNGGLAKGTAYRLTVIAENTPGLGGGVTVMSTAGQRLQVGLNVGFTTPNSNDNLVLFVDVVAGPPRVLVRGLDGVDENSEAASLISFGDGSVEYFSFESSEQLGLLPEVPGSAERVLVPLNFYSRPDEQFEVILRFNQPIFAASANVNSALIGLEYTYGTDGEVTPPGNPPSLFNAQSWESVPSTVSVIDNCTESGAAVRIQPTGIIPQNALLRVFVDQGFQDLTGDPVQSKQTRFGRFRSQVADPGGAEPKDGSDEILERFQVGGDQPGSLEDTTVASALPRANWSSAGNQGTLEASFDFDGTGGPNGEFDWYIQTGETVFLDTSGDQIVGGPCGAPSFVQPVFNGVVDVRDLWVQPGAQLVIIGSNTATILATGNVIVDGTISIDGGDNGGVVTLDTTNFPEDGAAGQAGGGSGGVGSFLTAQSTPKGGDGNGAFEVPGAGGRGGETGFAPGGTCDKDNRRGAGGGGGRFGPDIEYIFNGNFVACQSLVGMDGEPGFIGSPDGTGAITQTQAAQGGDLAPSPFTDARDDNDFFGAVLTAPDINGDRELILGELTSVWAGSGGGAGGDASETATFPMTPFDPTGDEKGSGGGGGAGGILVLALGRDDSAPGDCNILNSGTPDQYEPGILIRAGGSVTADGGFGGGGENSIFFDRIGGGSGGGSGGHIVFSSASAITIESEPTGPNSPSVGDFYLDDPDSSIHEFRPFRALGGQGGAGRESECGANEDGPTLWRQDAIPIEAFRGDGTVPPQLAPVWQGCNAVPDCAVIVPPEGTTPGAGGDGSPGIIQLHVSDPLTQLLFPSRPGVYGVDLDPTRSMAPPPLGWRLTAPGSANPTEADIPIPFFSARSEAFSRWIPIGLARLERPSVPIPNPDPGGLFRGVEDMVEFFFEGTDPADGSVMRDGAAAMELAQIFPLAGWAAVTNGGAAPSVDLDEATFTIPGASIDEVYRRNAQLMREFSLRVRDVGTTNVVEFIIQSGNYRATEDEFDLVVDPQGSLLADQFPAGADKEMQVVPYFFRLEAGGIGDLYPPDTDISISFDAAKANPNTGMPSSDPCDLFSQGDLSNFATDITELNTWMPGDDPSTPTIPCDGTEGTFDFIRFRVEFNLDESGNGVDLGVPRPGLRYLRVPYRF